MDCTNIDTCSIANDPVLCCISILQIYLFAQPIKCQCCTYIETNYFIFCANQLTGFYEGNTGTQWVNEGRSRRQPLSRDDWDITKYAKTVVIVYVLFFFGTYLITVVNMAIKMHIDI